MVVHGASGYIPKNLLPQTIKDAISRILAGEIWVPSGVSLTPPSGGTEEGGGEEMDIARRFASLSRQQLRVLSRIEKPNIQIAFELNIVEQTVKAHVSSILVKLKVRNRTAAAKLAERHLNKRE